MARLIVRGRDDDSWNCRSSVRMGGSSNFDGLELSAIEHYKVSHSVYKFVTSR